MNMLQTLVAGVHSLFLKKIPTLGPKASMGPGLVVMIVTLFVMLVLTPAWAGDFQVLAPGSQGVRMMGGLFSKDNSVVFVGVTPVASYTQNGDAVVDLSIGAGPSLRTLPSQEPMWDATATGCLEFFGGLVDVGVNYNTLHRQGVGLGLMFRAVQFGGAGTPTPTVVLNDHEARAYALINVGR